MPRTEVVFYLDVSGSAPVLSWLRDLVSSDRRGFAKCKAVIHRLVAEGYELRRPVADTLGAGIHELRARRGHTNYRILYSFYGKNHAVLLHAFAKEGTVPVADLRRAVERKRIFESDPMNHTLEVDRD